MDTNMLYGSVTIGRTVDQWRSRFPLGIGVGREKFTDDTYAGYVDDLFPVPFESVRGRVLAAISSGRVSETLQEMFCVRLAAAIQPLSVVAARVPFWNTTPYLAYSDHIRNVLDGVRDAWLRERVAGSLFAFSLLLTTELPVSDVEAQVMRGSL